MEKMMAGPAMTSGQESGKPAKKAKADKLSSMHVEMADNGYIVRCEYESSDKKNPAYETTRKVFTKGADVAEFVEDMLE